nr:trehalose-6-phosphate synthase [Tomitella gaofuii]
MGGRAVRVDAFPVAADGAVLASLARSGAVRRRARQMRAELGDPRTVILSVDRLDYTKGVPQRLDALDKLYAQRRLDVDRHVTVQIVTPSRERIPQYRELRKQVETRVGRINGAHGRLGQPAVRYLHRSVDRDEMAALLVAADLMLVTPLRDGMNLVAKEYAACHPEGDGALVLSEFAGAAAELDAAYLVNPYDTDQLARMISTALDDAPDDRRRRMSTLHAQILRRDVHAWAREYLSALGATRTDAHRRTVVGGDRPRPRAAAGAPTAGDLWREQ